MEGMRNAYELCCVNLNIRGHLQDRRIILEWMGRCLSTGFIRLRVGSSDFCAHGYEPSGSIKGREFPDLLSDC